MVVSQQEPPHRWGVALGYILSIDDTGLTLMLDRYSCHGVGCLSYTVCFKWNATCCSNMFVCFSFFRAVVSSLLCCIDQRLSVANEGAGLTNLAQLCYSDGERLVPLIRYCPIYECICNISIMS